MPQLRTVLRQKQLDRPCRNCSSPIAKGQAYYDGGRRGAVHKLCWTTPPPVFPHSIFGEENLLPTQANSAAPWIREQYLYLEILRDAIDCIFRYQFPKNKQAAKLGYDAMEWIQDPGGLDWPCSFVNCCYAIGANPDYVRSGILRKREGRLADAKCDFRQQTRSKCNRSYYGTTAAM